MDNKLSELSKPVGHFIEWQDEETGEKEWCECSKENGAALYSQEYVSALLAELEAKDKRIADLEAGLLNSHHRLINTTQNCSEWERKAISNFEECATMSQHIEELQKRLATPVRLPDSDIDSALIMAHWCSGEEVNAWVKGINYAKQQIRAAGFTVEGDE